MTGDYKIVVGCPNLRVYKGDIVVSVNTKPLLFNGFDESTVLNLNARVRRVRKKDILHCANNGINLLLYLEKTPPLKNTRKGSINQIRLYDDWCDWATRCGVSVRNNDIAPLLEYLYKRVNNYVAHLSYLDINCDDLCDMVRDSCIDIANMIVKENKTIFAPDNYIIRTAKNRILKQQQHERKGTTNL